MKFHQQKQTPMKTLIPSHITKTFFSCMHHLLYSTVSHIARRRRFMPLSTFFFFSCLAFAASMAVEKELERSGPNKDSGPVVPTTSLVKFLERLQHAALLSYGDNSTFDPKFYVDLSLRHRYDLSDARSAFTKLTSSRNTPLPTKELEAFIGKYFDSAGEDLVTHEPEDFVPEPLGFLPKVENEEVRTWAREVHGLWRNLSRRVSDSVSESPKRHTLLPLPEPVIIPGSRFREVYYWDSYWVIRGLVASEMYTTAKDIVKNLITLVETYGYVLNGARAYYTNRSQPPLLSSMVYEIYSRTSDRELLERSIPVLVKEYEFWNSGKHRVIIRDGRGFHHALNRYYAMWNKPRPESSIFDQQSAVRFTRASEKKRFYRDLASAAESGWDFSSRWMRDPSNFTTLATTSVVPVDLNVLILKMELDIAFLMEASGDRNGSERFLDASKARERAIETVFWNETAGQWLDYWLTSDGEETETWRAQNQNSNAFASNFVPIWINRYNSDANLVKKVARALQDSELIASVGIATSTVNTGQQWDFPNGWAPRQHMIVEGFVRSEVKEAREMAEEIARRWIRSSYAVYKKTGTIHEKLNVAKFGEFGSGGEYTPQTGFGWSNGVILAFLEEFGWPRDLTP